MMELLPMVLNSCYVSCVCKVPVLEQRLVVERREAEEMVAGWNKMQRLCNKLMTDCEHEQKEKFMLKVFNTVQYTVLQAFRIR